MNYTERTDIWRNWNTRIAITLCEGSAVSSHGGTRLCTATIEAGSAPFCASKTKLWVMTGPRCCAPHQNKSRNTLRFWWGERRRPSKLIDIAPLSLRSAGRFSVAMSSKPSGGAFAQALVTGTPVALATRETSAKLVEIADLISGVAANQSRLMKTWFSISRCRRSRRQSPFLNIIL